jgi:hypothetical protein
MIVLYMLLRLAFYLVTASCLFDLCSLCSSVPISRNQTLSVNRTAAAPGPLYDVAIIGGGVIGCSIARELSKTLLRV